MKVQIVFDQMAKGKEFFTEWGFACFTQGILFDTGSYGDGLLRNLKLMRISLDTIDKVVLSHDHWDHWGGLWALLEAKPGLPVYGCAGFSDDTVDRIREAGGQWIPVSESVELAPGIWTTGEIPATYKSEYKGEQGLLFLTDSGVSLLSGCAHPGIEVMAQEVRRQYPEKNLFTVMGGFHLFRSDDQEVQRVLDQLKSIGFHRILPLHCSGDLAREITGTEDWKAGMAVSL